MADRQSSQDVFLAHQRFGAVDYSVFAAMMIVSASIGVYFGFCRGKMTKSEYIVGGRNMRTLPVAMSLVVSYVSGISYIGKPTEVYLYGVNSIYTILTFLIVGLITRTLFLPVLHDLQVTSVYEYLDRRFNKSVGVVACLMYIIHNITWMPVVLYVPALTFNQVSGVSINYIAPIVIVVCIFYTCVGGMKAVVWTDVVQTCAMMLPLILVIFKGTAQIGGFAAMWEINLKGERLQLPSASLDFIDRYNIWGILLGNIIYNMLYSCCNQFSMQRYSSLPNIQAASRALWIYMFGASFFFALSCYCGLLVYATYHDCDPISTQVVTAKDQLFPLLVTRVFQGIDGLPGIFIAGVFSSSLSTLSTSMNAVSAVILEDLYRPWMRTPMTQRHENLVLKSAVISQGMLYFALFFVVQKLGTIVQLADSLTGIISGPTVAIFTLGCLVPSVGSRAMLLGSVTGLSIMSWICFGAQAAMSSGHMKYDTKPVSVSGCTYNFTLMAENMTDETAASDTDVLFLYKISFMWYHFVGFVLTSGVTLVATVFLKRKGSTAVDPKLFSPVIRRFLVKATAPKPSEVDQALLDRQDTVLRGELRTWNLQELTKHC